MTMKVKVEGANLYLRFKIKESLILKFGDLEAEIFFTEFESKNSVRIAIKAPREIKIDRHYPEVVDE